MTDAEFKAYLKTLTPQQLVAMIQAAGGGTAPEFVDYNRPKLLAKYSATSGEGRAIRDAYEFIDAGVDPVEVAQRVIAAQAEYDITPEALDEITGTLGDYASASSKFARENPRKTDIEALKDLGMTELAPLLPYTNTATQPVSIKPESGGAGDVDWGRISSKAGTEAENLSKQLLAMQKKSTKPGAGSVAKNFFLDPMRLASNFNPVLGLLATPFFLGKAKKKAAKEQLDVVEGDKASTPYTLDEFKEQQKVAMARQEQLRQQRLAEQGARYQQGMNESYNKAYLEELARLAKAREGKPTAFDVKRAAMLRALNG
jgi:hypothetical protein